MAAAQRKSIWEKTPSPRYYYVRGYM
jgi:hypothetical protein